MTALPDPDTPIRLADIIPLAFKHGGMTPSGLRREAARGNLTIMRMAGKDFTTLAYIEEMKRKCRVNGNPQGSGSGPQRKTVPQSGSSSTEDSKRALVAAREIAARLKGISPDTSQDNTRRNRKQNTEQLRKFR